MYPGYVGTFCSHILSLLSAVWAIVTINGSELRHDEHNWIRLAFIITAVNSCLALVRYGNLTFGYKLKKHHVLTLNLSTIISFSILESVLHSIHASEYLMHIPLFNAIPFLYNVHTRDYRTKLNVHDSIVAINSLILCSTSYFHENYYSIAMNVTYLFGYFVIGDSGFLFDTELPSVDAYQYLTCFLNVFAVNSLLY